MLRAPFTLIGNVLYFVRFLLSQVLYRLFSIFSSKKQFVQLKIDRHLPLGQHRIVRWFDDSPTLLDFREQAEVIAKDKSVAGVVLRIEHDGLGVSRSADMYDALQPIRDAGKKIIAHADQGTLKTYALMASCDQVVVPPSGRLYAFGLRIENFFLKPLFEKLGVSAQFLHIGEFKTATNRFVRDGMADSERAMMTSLLSGIEQRMIDRIATGRGITTDEVEEALDIAPIEPRAARRLKLIDGEAFDADLAMWLARGDDHQHVGLSDVEPADIVDLDHYATPLPFRWKPLFRRPKVLAVMDLSGMITHPGQQTRSDNAIVSTDVIPALKKLRENRRVAGVLLYINSPGGSALASDLMWSEIEALRSQKPVVAYCGDVVASGGYYLAVGADRIVCREETITGSIGVITGKMSAGEAADKIGVNFDHVQNRESASFMSLTEPLSGPLLKNFTRETRGFYRRFLERVGMARDIPKRRLHRFARGRVYLAAQAKERGLIDEIGGFDTAVNVLKSLVEESGKPAPQKLQFVTHGKPNLGAAIRKSATGGSAIAQLVARVDEKIPTDMIGLLESEAPLYLMPFSIR